MAYTSILKDSCWIDVLQIADWINIKDIKVSVAGVTPSADNLKRVRRLEVLANAACDHIESIIDTKVLASEFTEVSDGNSSNSIIPQMWPILSVNEIRIDYNRGFSDPTILTDSVYFLRGNSDKRQKISDTELRIIGNDVILRDDNERHIVGQIFSGSVLGAIKMKYLAGWCKDFTSGIDVDTELKTISCTDIPYDLILAALQLVEYWYYQRENKDIGVTAKGVMGESYSKLSQGIPQEIQDKLERYINYSFGSANQNQRNTWDI